MKETNKGISLAVLCSWLGITRQAYYQHKRYIKRVLTEESLILEQVLDIRSKHPRMGGKKLFSKVKPFLQGHGIKLGRDGFLALLNKHNLLVRKSRRRYRTTYSDHWLRKYPNLIKGITPLGPNHILVCDITYWKTRKKLFYISFITDAYSKMILGSNIAETLEALESVKALRKALRRIPHDVSGMIHHSDRGVQYCSSKYVKLLLSKGIAISMTESGDPLDNAIAERINGIIKGEYLFDYDIDSLAEAKRVLSSVVKLYNEERPHLSLNNMHPMQVHMGELDREIKRLWKNYYRKEKDTKQDVEIF